MGKNIIIVCIIIILSSCTTTRQALRQSRDTIEQLEQLNDDRRARNTELESLINAERAGNKELERIISEQQSSLNGYIESERARLERERQIIDSLSGIFSEGSDLIRQLKKGYRLIRAYFESQTIME